MKLRVDCAEDHSMRGAECHLWLRNRQALFGVHNLMLAPGYQTSAATDTKKEQLAKKQ